MKNKTFKKLGFIVLGLIIVALIFIVAFFTTSYEPSTQAMANLEDSTLVDVTENNFISFTPENTTATTGLIIYPGAKVEPEAYAPLANKIAQAGYEVIITPMPLNFAIFDSNAADEVISKFPNIKNWVISGHSLGGVMAAKYASENSNIKGVIFYASYPQGDELKDSNIEVTSIYGSLDGVADLEKIIGSKDLLPTSTTFVEITGGNHAQFGSYGEQSGDNPAEISADEQIEKAANASIELLDKISK
ncbi:alpha/beta hydrolase [Clostridium saudiense]|uniref:Alpha/beta hydrolase n=1 Tax=Clostridium saudiense TaxID=1414720 RepID=A0ABS2FB87_9CLOT|nr:alpha/beta hydrolase [Clostridium saudiense]MBM6817798.1 alpha/beta hydrolase [Clostridium saudiense]